MATEKTTTAKASVFATLNAINVNEHTEQKNGLTYVSWAWCWQMVKKNYPAAFYTIYENENGRPYFDDGRTCWVKTGLTIEGLEHIEYLPGILAGDSDAVFMGYFKERLSGLFAKAVRQSQAVPYDYILNHMVNDFAEAIRWWAKHSQYSPEEISAFFFETTPGIK